MLKARYTVYANGWWYDEAWTIDEAVEKARRVANSPSANEIEVYDKVEKKSIHKWTRMA